MEPVTQVSCHPGLNPRQGFRVFALMRFLFSLKKDEEGSIPLPSYPCLVPAASALVLVIFRALDLASFECSSLSAPQVFLLKCFPLNVFPRVLFFQVLP